jgi:hypothetical protein
MMVVMLIAGIGCLLAGLVAIGFGIPVKEFSFGNTLILSGAIGACAGLVMLGLWCVVRELQGIAERLDPGMHAEGGEITGLLPRAMPAPQRPQPAESGGFLFSRDQPPEEQASFAEPDLHAPASLGDETLPMPEPVEAPPVSKSRRNLMFSSNSRRERERAQSRAVEQFTTAPATMQPQDPEPSEPPAGTFRDAWPRSERARPAEAVIHRRGGRAPSTFSEVPAGTGGSEEQPPVTVLKSGVVDGMAYSLYSDGSIEAQMPEGMMRFASIDELRAHLDQRP